MRLALGKKEQAEIDYYRDSLDQSPEADSIENIINKITDCKVFVDLLGRYRTVFANARTVLELGGGQGWASAALKKLFPHLKVTLTDISEYAIQSRVKWERIFEVSIDSAHACRSYETQVASESFDCVFCYASAHHFVKQRKSLREIHRILRKGGTALYLHEPSTSSLFHPMAYARVNRKRPTIEEDVLIHSRIHTIAIEEGFDCRLDFNPTLLKRAPFEMLYYMALGKIRYLTKILPCTVNYQFIKK